MQKDYTEPIIKKGKLLKEYPEGKKRNKALASNSWYIEFYVLGKQHRVRPGNLNRVKDPEEKRKRAEVERDVLSIRLYNGWRPSKKGEGQIKLFKTVLILEDGINAYFEYLKKHEKTKKTIQTYSSKLTALQEHLPEKLISHITTEDIERFIQDKIDDKTYSNNSVKAAKRIFSTFFNTLIKLKHLQHNPLQQFDKNIRSYKEVSKRHVPYSDTDLARILNYLDANDPYSAFFCRMIFYTCIRPAEIRGLRVGDINFENKTIKIPYKVKKVKRDFNDDIVVINETFIPFLTALNLDKYPKTHYLTGDSKTIIGEKKIGENTPYNKLIAAFKALDKAAKTENPSLKHHEMLVNKGYDLYSFKHLSNIKRFKAGWDLEDIMLVNRHKNLSTTHIYLKNIGMFSEKQPPLPII